jgi:hypothetical protein
MVEVYNPSRVLSEDWRTMCVERRFEPVALETLEGPIEMNYAYLLVNLMINMPIIERGFPIPGMKTVFPMRTIYGNKVQAGLLENVVQYLESHGYVRDNLGRSVMSVAQASHNIYYSHLAGYPIPLDIFSIAKTFLQPEVEALLDPGYGDKSDQDIHRMSEQFRNNCKRLTDLLKSSSLPFNALRSPLITGSLKEQQFWQFAMSVGPRSDSDERIFLEPVDGAFLTGMKDIIDFALESRAAAKAKYYSYQFMPQAAYTSRKNHIQTSVFRYLYRGDCGSKVFLEYHPTKETFDYHLGRFYKTDDGGLREITTDNKHEVLNKDILLRDPHGCRYVDGVCEVCMGTISKHFPTDGNIGFIANSKTTSPMAQAVLSAKHLAMPIVMLYSIPPKLVDIFYSNKNNDIYFHDRIKSVAKNRAIGFDVKDVKKIDDLQHTTSDDLKSSYYSKIMRLTYAEIDDRDTIGRIIVKSNMESEVGKAYPHLATEVLNIIRKDPSVLIRQGNTIWLRLDKIDLDKPVMQCTVMNDSIRFYVADFREFVTTRVERYTSANLALRDLCKIIWGRVGAHSSLISILLRSCLVTSATDYSIPAIKDPDDVMYARQSKIIPMRSVANYFAFQGYAQSRCKTGMFIIPKRRGQFDEMMGYTDTIARDANWPPYSDVLHEIPMGTNETIGFYH